ncbi:MAG: Ig-like domain-containing protein [Planctomycetes bacterium]|nr:Ig-like domain-containing protein [Planctomycetota bacterium]
MRNAFSPVFVGLLAIVAGGCSSGSTSDTSSVRIPCAGGQKFCVISCDLGCSQTGCSITEIAENQKIHFKFSDAVKAATVNSASISIRTATGVAPEGDFLVNGAEVTFLPRVTTVGGVSSFGFQRNQSYIITVAGGRTASQGVQSLSGVTLSNELTCTVVASKGIVDEDGQPPTVEMVSPTNLTAAPRTPTIVLRFSELIDTTPLQGTLSSGSPVRVVLRSTTPTGECDLDASGTVLEGVPSLSTETVGGHEVTVVTFTPTVQLPSVSCVTVEVTADLRDLSGRAGVPAAFQFITEQGASTPIQLNESFANANGQNQMLSGGIWSGGARPGLVGGDGRHGSFDVTLGSPVGGGVYEWNTDSFTIPASSSLTGLQYTINDGRFYFTDFVLPEGTTLRWKGSVPAQVYVRGKAEVRGTINVSAEDLPYQTTPYGPAAGQRLSAFMARSTGVVPLAGQLGGAAYCGGGAGGDGGRKCLSAGPIIENGVIVTDGQSGRGIYVGAGHAYAGQALDTGGRGSPLWPASGLNNTSVVLGGLYNGWFSVGGTGGGFVLPGTTATGTLVGANISASPVAGISFPVAYPVTPPANYSSLNHYVIGGSGGGGGGSHGFCTYTIPTGDKYIAGSAGSGGGGAMALRAGGDLLIASTAQLLSKGGAGVLINGDDPANNTSVSPVFGYDINRGISSPGGGGSGGSFLLQSGKVLTVSGAIDTSGGSGSRAGYFVASTFSALNIQAQAGAGSHGFFRLEAGNNVSFSGTSVPAYSAATHAGTLADRDDISGDISTWRGTGLLFPPTWLRYELDVDLYGDGSQVVTYTDSGAAGTSKANDLLTHPVVIKFQGANLNQSGTEPIEGSEGEWREGIGNGAGPGISLDSVTGFRFSLTYNRATFPNVVVRALRVYGQS